MPVGSDDEFNAVSAAPSISGNYHPQPVGEAELEAEAEAETDPALNDSHYTDIADAAADYAAEGDDGPEDLTYQNDTNANTRHAPMPFTSNDIGPSVDDIRAGRLAVSFPRLGPQLEAS
jgi:hypothetical protein